MHFSHPKIANKLQVKRKKFETTAQSAIRWTSGPSIKTEQLIKHYTTVAEALKFERDQGENTDSVQAIGILSSISTAGFVVKFFYCIFDSYTYPQQTATI